MTEQEALARMIAPGTRRPRKYRDGVIQIHVTRSCDKSCFNCTQGSNLGGKTTFITLEQFAAAVDSLRGYFGVVGIFGGNPALHPQFVDLCRILRESWVPKNQRGVWSNNPINAEKCKAMRETFDPAVSNLNVHLDRAAYNLFRAHWPECHPVGLTEDSRHSPPYVAMKDVIPDEDRRWELISNCDINKHWSAMIGVFRGELRAWFCEIAGAQAMLHQDEPDYPDTGWPMTHRFTHPDDGHLPHDPNGRTVAWWQLPMSSFAHQVRKHCHECGVPLKGHGALAQGSDESQVEQCSPTHQNVYKPKRKGRRIELVTVEGQLGERLGDMTRYIQNARV